MFDSPEPPEVAAIHPSADPAYAAAPLPVRRAVAWREAAGHHAVEMAMFIAFAVTILPIFLGAIGSTGRVASGVMVALPWFAVTIGWVNSIDRRWGRTEAWASEVIRRWTRLQELVPVASAPAPPADPIDTMVARIDDLAGEGGDTVRDGAARAAARIRRLETELGHLEGLSTGRPEADAALVAARERVNGEIADTRAQVGRIYAALVDRAAGRDAATTDDLEQVVQRLHAEIEVDAAPGRARCARPAMRA